MATVLHGLPLVKAMPSRVVSMEYACNDLWRALKIVSTEQLKLLKPTPEYRPLIDALIDVRTLMGDMNETEYIR